MHPFGPLWVEPAVWLLVFGLEHPDYFAVNIFDEIAATAPLVDAGGIDAGVNRCFRLPHNFVEGWIIWGKTTANMIYFEGTL